MRRELPLTNALFSDIFFQNLKNLKKIYYIIKKFYYIIKKNLLYNKKILYNKKNLCIFFQNLKNFKIFLKIIKKRENGQNRPHFPASSMKI